jgi:hypothetical protein
LIFQHLVPLVYHSEISILLMVMESRKTKFWCRFLLRCRNRLSF